jgi:hypothetical protein
MIRRVGVIYQDAYSLGFLRGLQRRLNCGAELVGPPAGLGRIRFLTKNQAKQAYVFFKSRSVDLIVELTDADRDRWQEVRRRETEVFPPEVQSQLVCGATVNNTEEWLATVPEWLSSGLNIDDADLRNHPDPSSLVKAAIGRGRRPAQPASELVEQLVIEAPPEVFKSWLAEPSFAAFYRDCRGIAARFGCETTNEL